MYKLISKAVMQKIYLPIFSLLGVSVALLSSCKKSNNAPVPAGTNPSQTMYTATSAANVPIDSTYRIPWIALAYTPTGVYNVSDFGAIPTRTLSSKGDIGIPIPEVNNIVISVNRKLFVFTKQQGDLLTAEEPPFMFYLGYVQTTIRAINKQENAEIRIVVGAITPGIYVVKEVSFMFDAVGAFGPTWATYSTFNYNGGGYINVRTDERGHTVYVATKGTFDSVVGFRSGIIHAPDQLRISGAFNVGANTQL